MTQLMKCGTKVRFYPRPEGDYPDEILKYAGEEGEVVIAYSAPPRLRRIAFSDGTRIDLYISDLAII